MTLHDLWLRLRAIVAPGLVERELDDELSLHIEMQTRKHVAAGMGPGEARRRTQAQFGSTALVEDTCRDARGISFVDTLLQDTRYAYRLWRRRPGFAMAAIASLALVIGANTLVFSIVNALILRPLPAERPEQLAFVEPSRDGSSPSLSFPNYRDFRDRNNAFSGLMAYRLSPMNLELESGPVRVWGYLATGNYFDLLGIRPVAGRLFKAEDDRQPGAAPLAVLSYDCWQRRFFGDPGVVGRTIRISRLPYSVIGVASRGFHGTEVIIRPEIWVPMMMQAQIEVGNPWLESRNAGNSWVLGRLKPGVTAIEGESNLNVIAADLAREYPTVDGDLRVKLTRPGLVGDLLRAPMKAFTLGVMLLVSLVLLAGCANLASILLAHGADRRREIALRLSIGAGPGRVRRQLLTESLLLSLASGLVGASLAAAGATVLSNWRVDLDLPMQADVGMDARAILFGLAASLVAGVVIGLAPARQASRIDPNTALKGGGESVRLGNRKWAFRDVLVVLQVAISVVLMSACVLSLRGLQEALTLPLGFDPNGIAVAGLDLGLAGYTRQEGQDFQQRVLEAVRHTPGVEAAAYANSLPLSLDQSSTTVFPEHERRPGLPGVGATYYQVSPGFLPTLGIRLLTGRDFETRDRQDRPAVAIVNQTFARSVLQSPDAVGTRFRYGRTGSWVEVVGIVQDGKYWTLTEAPRPVVFQPILQRYNSTTTVVVRSRLPDAEAVAGIRRTIASLDPGLPVHGTGSLDQVLRFAWLPNRVAAIALSALGVLALVLAATGLNGLVAYSVARRQKEIGLRLAIGAGRGHILRLVLTRVGVTVGVGAGLGLTIALAAGPLLARIVYQASPRDPFVMMAVGGVLVAIGIVSCWSPLRRSLRIDPMAALRHD